MYEVPHSAAAGALARRRGARRGGARAGGTIRCLLLMESGAINARPRYDLFATHSPRTLRALID